jgi:hypothetical protein
MRTVHVLATGIVGMALCMSGCELAAAQDNREQSEPEKAETKPGETKKEATAAAKQKTTSAEPTVVVIVSKGNAKAVEAIARARCEREMRCDNIGTDKKWASAHECLQKVSADWGEDLNGYECPGGVHASALDKCVSAIRGQECGKAMDALTRVLSCRVNDICKEKK